MRASPPAAPQVLHWTEAFTARLAGRVKQVGSVISCEGSPKDGNAAGEWRSNPYVLPYAWATDKVGGAGRSRAGRGGAGRRRARRRTVEMNGGLACFEGGPHAGSSRLLSVCGQGSQSAELGSIGCCIRGARPGCNAPCAGNRALQLLCSLPHGRRCSFALLPRRPAAPQAGWEVLQKEGAVFKCYDNPWDARYYSDSGASLALLKARKGL